MWLMFENVLKVKKTKRAAEVIVDMHTLRRSSTQGVLILVEQRCILPTAYMFSQKFQHA